MKFGVRQKHKGGMEKAVLNTREVAEYLGLKPGEVRRLVDEGILKPLRGFRRPFKFSRHVIDKYLRGESFKG